MQELVLASQSPRRKEILAAIGVRYTAVSPEAQELHPQDTHPDKIVLENALAKAASVACRFADSLVIGCDTIVYFQKEILIKPPDFKTACRYLLRLSGNTHTVYSGLAIIDTRTNAVHSDVSTTEVTFANLNGQRIEQYIGLINPYDKAGGYAIQGAGSLIVESINGCFFNVMGLPVRTLDNLLGMFGTSLFDYARK